MARNAVLIIQQNGFLYSQVCTFSFMTVTSRCLCTGIAAVVQGQRNTAASCWESSAVRNYAVFAIFPLPYRLSREMSTCCSSPGTSHLLVWVLLCHCKWTEVSYWNHQLHKYVSGAPSHGVWVFFSTSHGSSEILRFFLSLVNVLLSQ